MSISLRVSSVITWVMYNLRVRVNVNGKEATLASDGVR